MGLKKKRLTTHGFFYLFFFFFSFLSLFFFFYDLHFLCAWENRGQKGKLHSPQGNTVPPALHTASLSGSFLPLLPLFFVCFLCQKQADTSFFFSVRSSFFFFRGHFFSSPFRFLWLYPHSDPCFFFLRSLLSIEVYFKLTLWSTVVLTFFLPLLRLLVYSYVLMCPLFFASSFFFSLFECSGSKK